MEVAGPHQYMTTSRGHGILGTTAAAALRDVAGGAEVVPTDTEHTRTCDVVPKHREHTRKCESVVVGVVGVGNPTAGKKPHIHE